MPQIVNCPQCQRELRVPDELYGRRVKCPACGVMFAATEQSSPGVAGSAGTELATAAYEKPADERPPEQESYGRPRGEASQVRRAVEPVSICLMITGILQCAFGSCATTAAIVGIGAGVAKGHGGQAGVDQAEAMLSGALGLAFWGVWIVIGLVVAYAGYKLKRLESYGWCMTGAVLAVIPFAMPACCLWAVPVGVWALVVLNRADVREAFR